MQLVLASLLPLLCASFAPLPSRPSRRVVLSASIDDEEVAQTIVRKDEALVARWSWDVHGDFAAPPDVHKLHAYEQGPH